MTSRPTPATTAHADDADLDERPETVATSVAPVTTSDTPAPTVTTTRRRARRRRRILVTLLVVLLGAAIAAGAYLWQVAEAWIDRDAQWQGHVGELSASLGSVSSDLDDTMAELEVVRGQLDEAQVRISELADEKAQLGDEHAVVRQLAEYQERVSLAATAVVSALDSCIASQQRLIRWYDETGDPEPEDLERYLALSESLTVVCSEAQRAKEALQEELEG